ncbi:MAG: chromosomal replication initiator protein DnaA, partial [Parcubacteria group bacterium GW2011_GWF2_43_11]
NRLIAYQKLNNQSPSLAVAETLLKSVIFSPKKVTNAEKIIQAVSVFYSMKERDILTACRKKEIVKPRQVAMFLLRQELKSSFPFIGGKFGGKDHTTAIHAYNKISKEIESSENLAEEINLIREQIYRP